ncbi:ABC transporter permease [Rubrimonas cliftonensis]|uniref:Amino acid ABC transporter membrane protein 2, PAAT family n=1 Tax=Rubrimonas cliftonensis TaxID=89524 RepID=A0A1H4BDN0_9RHOB|nr:ABC transporter permease [Rubrimonas cliftonensis]SEA46305.1 amino acid ABC transporter membrane protein 2, PAAT family [Rubrimonas cliftonensis]
MEAMCAAAAAASEAGSPWFFNPCLVLSEAPRWVEGVWITLHLTALALVFGFVLALPMACARAARAPVVDTLVRGYVYVFRGSPLLVQLFLIYYGLAQFGFVRDSLLWPVLRDAWWCCLIAFTLNSAAYQTEILRGALVATAKGDREACAALGMSPWLAARRVLIPGALRRALPQLGNETVFMLHGSAIASLVTIQDILGVGRLVNGRYYVVYEGLLTAAALYMALTWLVVWGVARLERRYLRHLAR